jgi:hypothetical protein
LELELFVFFRKSPEQESFQDRQADAFMHSSGLPKRAAEAAKKPDGAPKPSLFHTLDQVFAGDNAEDSRYHVSHLKRQHVGCALRAFLYAQVRNNSFVSRRNFLLKRFCDDRKQRQKAGFCNSKRRREKCEGPKIESDQKKKRKNWRFEHAKDQKRKLEVDDVAFEIGI